MSKHDYRAYCFTNALYMSPIQLGIQSAHAISEMFSKYTRADSKVLYKWAAEDKTIIVLNGGNCADLNEILYEVRAICNQKAAGGHFLNLPFACFHEDEASLGGVITAVTIILPKEIYQARQTSERFDPEGIWFYEDDKGRHIDYQPDSLEAQLLRVVKSCRLA